MRVFSFIITLVISALLILGCSRSSTNYRVSINRFDIDLATSLENYEDDSLKYLVITKYPSLFYIYSNGVFGIREDSSKSYIINELLNRYNNVRFNRLYRDTESTFNDLSSIEDTLSIAFSNLSKIVPNFKLPQIYTHVSGFSESIITSDSIISVSLDNYLGADYDGYKVAFYNYLHRYKNPNNMAKDIIRGYLYLTFPISKSGATVADGMVYEGAILYLMQLAQPKWEIEELLSYNSSDIEWCRDNIVTAKEFMIKSNHLFSNDALTYQKHLAVAPFNSFFGAGSPPELGRYIGYDVVKRYIKSGDRDDIIKILLGEIDSNEIIKNSGF